ncbi:hypothetical protein PR048_009808 [Dryococelus australis]|uniref:Uncharacterized protein n=1 Tax=Dryococelus australis TaxID=614101 RepID=A0ABQ9I0W7_9NEOP|nr:hypothetical protein PR048_009808 [Dryococelus australis]
MSLPSTSTPNPTSDGKRDWGKRIFCQGDTSDGLQCPGNSKRKDKAVKLEDEKLLAKLSPGDIIAAEVKYNAKCSTSIYNKARTIDEKKSPDIARELVVSTTFAELVVYIEDTREDSDNKRFAVAAVDNIDYDPSSTTARERFHGTGISLFQFPKQEEYGQPSQEAPEYSVIIIDAAAVVHMITPKTSSIFQNYCDNEFAGHVKTIYLQQVQR